MQIVRWRCPQGYPRSTGGPLMQYLLNAFTAPVAGSGKTMLVDICSMIATGRRAPVLDQSKDDIETDKRLVAALLRGGSIVSIDNVDRPLDSALLCQALTAGGVMQVRPLGVGCVYRRANGRAMFYPRK